MKGGTLQATGGVTFVFERACPNGAAGANPGTISIGDDSSANITRRSPAPPPPGLIPERYTCTAGGPNCTNKLEAGGTLNIIAAAYFPNNPVQYAAARPAAVPRDAPSRSPHDRVHRQLDIQ